MSSTPREIGTLIVVVLKANHLPNKKHIGKQDPYCVVTVNGEKRRTKAIKRGGQHPDWDEEIRFTLYEDTPDTPNKDVNGDGAPPPPPKEARERKLPKKIKGGRTMKLACFADDLREPDFIGEADVDLTEVLTKGETDEWFTLVNKDKFAGKVYLELTFWSNEPPPEKKVTPKPAKNKDYGGPGHFVPAGASTSDAPLGPIPRAVSAGTTFDHSRQGSDSIPSSLRASSSLAKLDLYVPPYERTKSSLMDNLTNEFSEFGVSQHPRRESFPPPLSGHSSRSSSVSSYLTATTYQAPMHGNAADPSTYSYNNNFSHFTDHNQASNTYQANFQPQYDHNPNPYHPPARGPRHSVPTTSSGFVPLHNSSGFQTPRPKAPDSDQYGGSPIPYNGSQYIPPSTYAPQLMSPSHAEAHPRLPSSGSFVPQQSFPQAQTFQYPQYPSSNPIPEVYSNTSSTPVPGQLPQVPSSTPLQYQAYGLTPAPSHESTPLTVNGVLVPSLSTSSRPLPQQPQVVYTQPQSSAAYTAHTAENTQHPTSSFIPPPGGPIYPNNGAYHQPLPPPPPPLAQYTVAQPQQQYPPNSQPSATLPPPPPPPPLQTNASSPTSRRQSSLPQPPVLYQQPQQPTYQPPPPPPPFPSESFNRASLPPPPPPPLLQPQDFTKSSQPAPPNHADNQGQWVSHPAPAAQGYV